MTWLTDSNGNKCSVEFFGTKEAAQKALDSLRYCENCINCSDCYRCSDCSDCYRCSRCSGCSDCSDCSDCYRCSGCYRCSDCSDCYRCSRCSGCSDCSDCSDCYRCSGCYRCSDCSDKKGDGTAGDFHAPKVPVIPDIHKRIYEAVTAPKHHLEMSDWHTCDTTHCRGGWVVTLAGKEGKELEKFHGSLLAAQLIYDASDTSRKFNPGRFFDSNEDALADMKKLAGK